MLTNYENNHPAIAAPCSFPHPGECRHSSSTEQLLSDLRGAQMNIEQVSQVSTVTFPVNSSGAARHLLLVFGLLVLSALEANPEGWVNIMPPTDLKGWSRVPVPPGGELGRAQWHVDAEKHLLVCDGDGGHDELLTEKEYGDAIFHFEFCYSKVEGKKGYNSGAYVRNSKDGAIWHQAQFGDSNDGFLFGVTPTDGEQGKFFSLKDKVTSNRVKPAGQWNTIEITARGKTLTLWVNGAVTCQFDGCGRKSGHVGLEGEGYRIEFRNLQLKQLRAE
jgi:hypothetical protein